ncbi:alpha-hydroxy acid oxidase [Streptomyces litchfieldiae]|uniref:Alpha-hydroxy acid oxidase n=1 Tax=Streptomyces litchfieldiae TaxID=3075543 RepID=A0ABU2MQS4_9ACTN|nr:alpha-hydroxy acid oxidase [Streptomyces sp. DSM 44938]MDT0343968.1 alpha-hydroxy acid oxidase [Streptomyces sp. DSM 44938]
MTSVPAPGPASSPMCLADLARAAEAAAPGAVWDFIEGGSGRELSLAANRAALDALYLVPRVLRDVARPDAGSRLVRSSARMPVAIAPMAYQRLLHPDGELATARAAKTAGVPFTVPMFSSVTVERVAESGAALWFQLYWLRDRGVTADLLDRAEAAGCRAVILTVDVARLGRRLRDLRNGFSLPNGVRAAHFAEERASAPRRLPDGSLDVRHYVDTFNPSVTWSDVAWLRERTRLPLVLKGILAPQDATEAVTTGADAIVVSNHGGRQLDGALPAIEALPGVREAVGDACEVLLDGGIRSGIDVLKSLARGASGVLLGRPVLHGLLAGGEDGAERALSLLRDEIDDALALVGCRHIGDTAELRLTRLPV